jgi:hypothetical protein
VRGRPFLFLPYSPKCLVRLSEKSGWALNQSTIRRQNGAKDPYFAGLCHQSLTIENASCPFSDSL